MVPAASPSACLLIVEGDDDEHVAAHLARANSAMPVFRTRVTRGFPNLLAAIGPEIKSPGRLALGMMVDANEDPQARWRSLRGRLKEENITLPDAPKRNGTIVEAGPRIGLWMMPDNQSPGELEDFIEKLIPPDDPVWKMACQFIDAIPDSERKFPGHKQTKAKVRAWLATRERPRQFGEAISKGDLPVSAPIAIALADWLRNLFTV